MNIGKKALAFLVTFLMLFSNSLVALPDSTVSADPGNGANGTTLSADVTVASKLEQISTWEIDKSVDKDHWDLFPGDTATSTYTISVTKTTAPQQATLSGTVTVTNGGGEKTQDLHISVSFAEPGHGDSYGSVTVDTTAMPDLAASNTYDYPYSFILSPAPPAGTDIKATAHITITNHSGHLDNPFGPDPSATCQMTSTLTDTNGTIHVSDSFNPQGSPWTFSDSGSVTYTRAFSASDAGEIVNTATIMETKQSDSETVTVRPITVSKVVTNADNDPTEFTIHIQGISGAAEGYSNDVKVSEKNGVISKTSSLKVLPLGQYEVTEVYTGTDYVKDGVTIKIGEETITNGRFELTSDNRNTAIAITATNHKKTDVLLGAVTIAKDVTNAPNDPTEFTVHIQGSGAAAGYSSDVTVSEKDGVTHTTAPLDSLPLGQYEVTEVYTGTDYIKDGVTIKIGEETITNGRFELTADNWNKTIAITATNRKKIDPGSLLIHKTSTLNGRPVAGVQFQVSTSSKFEEGTLLPLPNDGKTDANGDVLVGNLIAGTVYYVREIHQAPGYSIDTTIVKNVTIVSNETARVDFANDPVGKVRVTKVDSANSALTLPGAVYGVYSDEAATKLVQTLAATNGSGIATSGELPFGEGTVYYVKEITPPAGYALNAQVQRARFTEPEQIVNLIFENTKTVVPNGSLIIKKVDSLDAAKTLAGATFALYADEALTAQIGLPVTTGADGLARWDNLAAGAYWIVETAAPANYDRLTASIAVSVAAGVTNPGAVVIQNQYNPPEDIQTGSLVIRKVDSLNPDKTLKGATFALYADEALTTQVGLPVTTGADGLARWDGLDAGTYWVVETAAPENYDLMQVPLDVTVTAGVTNPDPVVIADQYNPPEDIQTGMMDWNILLIGAFALASGLLLFMAGRRKAKQHR